MEAFFVGQRGRFVVVRVRIPWSTRDVWDHGELRHMHFGYAQMLNPAIQSNRISPSRDYRYVIPTAESKPIWDPRSPEPLPVVKNTTPYTTYTMQPTVDSIVF
ncbi:hypothetical protein DIPPA_10567 [Diplonema papillatum]|nr:hypothetical protein DIPPA_10567 [Diplonema papillatum]